jgi:hypothetical protein
MKPIAIISLLLAAHSAASPTDEGTSITLGTYDPMMDMEFVIDMPSCIDKRQSPLFDGVSRNWQKKSPFKTENLEPTLKWPGAKRLQVWFGPYKLKALNVSHH